jgi:hypothetical protein
MARLLRIAVAALGFLVYAWFGGVRNAARAKRRKALRRRAQARETSASTAPPAPPQR